MPSFRFKSFSRTGELYEGSMVASGEAELESQLQRRGLRLITAQVSTENAGSGWRRYLGKPDKLDPTELLSFTGGFAALANAAIPLDEILKLLSTQSDSRRLKRVIARLHDGVNVGDTLAETMEKLPLAFSTEFVSIVRAGEMSASLGDVMNDMLRLLERRQEMRSKLRSAMLYPSILIVAALGAIVIVVSYLIPTLSPVFKDSGVPLPSLLSMILDLSHFLSDYWISSIALAVAVLLAFAASIRSTHVKRMVSGQIIKIPVIGAYIVKRNVAAFARTLGTLLKAGIAMPTASASALAVLSNDQVSKRLAAARGEMLEGMSLLEALRQSDAMPAMALSLIAVGEKTGKLHPMLFHLAKLYEADCEKLIDNALTLLTPLLTLAIGLMVGGLMTSIMSAVMSVNDLVVR